MAFIGLDEFAQVSIAGGATQAFGNVSGGEIGTAEQDINHNLGIGAQDDINWGMVIPGASIETIYKNEDLLDNCHRSVWNGLPTYCNVQGGIMHATSALAWQIASAYVDSVSVECGGIGEVVNVTYDLVATGATSAALSVGAGVATPTAGNAQSAFRWEQGAVTLSVTGAASAAYRTRNISVELSNNLNLDSDLDVKATGSRRLPTMIEPGDEEVSVSMSVEQPTIGFDPFNDAPSGPYNITWAISDGTNTKTFTLRHLFLTGIPVSLESGSDKVVYDLEFESLTNARRLHTNPAWAVA